MTKILLFIISIIWGYDYVKIPISWENVFQNGKIDLLNKNKFEINYIHYICETKGGEIFWENSNYGLSAKYFNSGKMIKTDALGNELGNFYCNQLLLKGIYKNKYKNYFKWQIEPSLLWQNIDTVFNIALALNGKIEKEFKIVCFALNIENFGMEIKSSDTKEYPPIHIYIQTSASLNQTNLFLNIGKFIDEKLYFNIGIEQTVFNILKIGGGYNYRYTYLNIGESSDILNGLYTGFSLNYHNIRFNFIYSPFGVLGNVFRLSIGYLRF